MATLTIFYGGSKPLKATGEHQCQLLSFAYRFPTWHSFSPRRENKRAVAALVKKGFLEVNAHGQFKINYPKGGV